MRRKPAFQAYLRPATSRIMCIARRSRRQARGAWPRSMRTNTSTSSSRKANINDARQPAKVAAAPAHPALAAMKTRFLKSIVDVPAAQWNALDPSGSPFLRHEFLAALEREGCVGDGKGWIGNHLVLADDAGRLQDAMPLYRKSHSWNEFVFDWSWAKAYAQTQLPYYPKLVS